MKKIITLFSLTITSILFSQIPQGISYQAIALNGSGNPVLNSNVGIRLSILDNSSSGTTIYSETHTKTTNPQGLFNLVIGQGTPVSGTFSGINWGTNSKFLKVELDAAGGTSYVLVGTTQLLSVPYSIGADTLITSPGEAITLISPNGTPYQISVNDAGQLSLPTSGVTGTNPSTLYMYGSFNSFNEATSLLMTPYNSIVSLNSFNNYCGYKYLTSGTQLKFLAQNNPSSVIYGINGSLNMITNGSAYTIPSNGFYYINMERNTSGSVYNLNIQSISPKVFYYNSNSGMIQVNPTYNSGTNTFSFILTGLTTSNFSNFKFYIERNEDSYSDGNFGDNLGDNTIDLGGSSISIPGINSTPKNFRIDLILNFNGSGTYTITQI